mmetsp:Transcript_16904/g.29025  ORF Transcript_16904/g.29025 Transcript_16904/m.29025 type:complete len:318 (-) Transcript_16904:18-971(-)
MKSNFAALLCLCVTSSTAQFFYTLPDVKNVTLHGFGNLSREDPGVLGVTTDAPQPTVALNRTGIAAFVSKYSTYRVNSFEEFDNCLKSKQGGCVDIVSSSPELLGNETVRITKLLRTAPLGNVLRCSFPLPPNDEKNSSVQAYCHPSGIYRGYRLGDDLGGYRGYRSSGDLGRYRGYRSGGDLGGYRGYRLGDDLGGYRGYRSGGGLGGYRGYRSGDDLEAYRGYRSSDDLGGYRGYRSGDNLRGYKGFDNGGSFLAGGIIYAEAQAEDSNSTFNVLMACHGFKVSSCQLLLGNSFVAFNAKYPEFPNAVAIRVPLD